MNRALVVIDVQNEYMTGRLPIAYPPLDLSLANIGLAMDAAHAQGMPVVVVQDTGPADDPIFAGGSSTWQLPRYWMAFHPRRPAGRVHPAPDRADRAYPRRRPATPAST